MIWQVAFKGQFSGIVYLEAIQVFALFTNLVYYIRALHIIACYINDSNEAWHDDTEGHCSTFIRGIPIWVFWIQPITDISAANNADTD